MLKRNAATCNINTTNTVAVTLTARTPLFMDTARIMPASEAAPTMIVIAISIGENVPERKAVQPSRNDQIAAISTSQNTKQGSAAHFVNFELRMPSTMAIQRTDVCTMCRMTMWDATPTTNS